MKQQRYDDVEALVDAIIERRGRRLKAGFPLGLGKPVHLLNALVERARVGEIESLEIFTALSLSVPRAGSDPLRQRLMEPIIDRLYEGVPDLKYVGMRAAGRLPESVRIHEFYYPPGSLLNSPVAQRDYKSVNFSDGFRMMKEAGLDLIGQMVTPSPQGWDLSSNTDLSKELFAALRERDDDDRPLLVAQVNRRLPPMGGMAVVDGETFDAVLDDEGYDHELFGMPSLPVSDVEYAIGLRVASLLRDGGTVQIGIGGLGDSVCWSSILRHEDPARFARILGDLAPGQEEQKLVEEWGGRDVFEEGLYAATEMFVEGLLHMARRGVLSREVDDGALLHGAFYLGSSRFYDALREMDEQERNKFSMRSVRFTNLLYGQEETKRRQRKHLRCINSAMIVTGLGAVVSDGLEDGRVVSGVGGQYEFVTMAHALPDGRSVIMVPATRSSRGEVRSNIVWSYGHCTIPRHLRDLVVTEYGVADLRGKSDEEIVKAMVGICDARFQDELVAKAKSAGKLAQNWEVPDAARRNRPERIQDALAPYRGDGTIPRCPFGSALSEVELDLVEALQHLKAVTDDVRAMKIPEVSPKNVARALRGTDRWDEHLKRMGLDRPSGVRERALQRAVIFGLKEVISRPTVVG